ncbi:unknow [Vibrio parahaemolyticus]|nr:unknow [Vibrio parahaemolyticus]
MISLLVEVETLLNAWSSLPIPTLNPMTSNTTVNRTGKKT